MHIREIKAGDSLRVALKAGHQFDPLPDGTAQHPAKPRRAFGYSTTTLYAYVISNDPAGGSMVINFQYGPNRQYASARLSYAAIRTMQFVISKGRPVVETAPKSHPGAQALGTKMAQLFQQPYLVPVTFFGS